MGRPPARKKFDAPGSAGRAGPVKDIVLTAIQHGSSVMDACAKANRSVKAYENWRSADPVFKKAVEDARAVQAEERQSQLPARQLDFEAWRKRFLRRDTYPHMRMWIDVLEGREPTDLHDSMVYQPGRPSRLLINVPPFHAKALAIDTVVPTPLGWTTIGVLRVGDSVFGLDGKPTEVTAKSEVFDKPCFRVTINDGESFIACEDHLWQVKTSRYSVGIFTTRQLFEKGGRFSLPPHSALEMGDIDLPLDPYVLGAWLGDGYTAGDRFTTADPETLDEFRSAGFSPVFDHNNGSLASSYRIPGLFRELSSLGVRGNKFIPEGYLFAGYGQRLALLQGLMDTDGTVSNASQCSFTNTKKDLAEGVLILASSLGLKPSIRESRATYKGRDCGPKWTVWFAPAGLPVFRLPRKLAKIRPAPPHRAGNYRRIVSVEPVDQVPTQCITVDNDSHVFLIGRSLVPTHNSTILTQEYVTYRICMDPTVRICIISKTQEKSKKFLFSTKKMLTSPQYAVMQAAYAPADGWRHADYPWTATRIYVNNPEGSEKDPTVEVLGIRGDIYGGRYDLIICDDMITKENSADHEKQLDWLNQEVVSRLYKGKLLIVGTRVSSTDLYSELRNPDNFTSGVSPWTYLAQPAVLEFAEDSKDWVTLWPRSNAPLDAEDPGEPDEDGTYAAWDGPALQQVRDSVRLATWSLVYMQHQVAEDGAFNPQCVRASSNRIRKPGVLKPGTPGHPRDGMEGQYIIGSMDPAMTGETFTLVLAVDKRDKMRRVLNCWVKASPSPAYIRDLIKAVTDEYSVNEWVIESNAFQLFLVHDPEIKEFLNTRGVKLHPHHSSHNKIDPDFGVASVAPLFGSLKVHMDGRRTGLDHMGDNLIELPDNINEGVKSLIDQLITWEPGKRGNRLKQDGPMALWFAELRARALLGDGRKRRLHFVQNPYLSRGDLAKQVVTPIEAYRFAQQMR